MEISNSHFNNIKALKSAILQSRYRAASLVNKELLTLYFAVGKFISHKIEEEKWGAKIIESLSADLQLELPGLRGFSASNIKRMRLLYESWKQHSVISPTVSGQLQVIDLEEIKFNPTVLVQLEKTFFGLSFSHHLEIIQNTETLEERIFYIQKTATEFWSLSTLKNHLQNQTFQKTGSLPNNFSKTITNDEVRQKALQSFRDFNKAMGVATYKTSTELPAAYRGVLPDVETLKKLMD